VTVVTTMLPSRRDAATAGAVVALLSGGLGVLAPAVGALLALAVAAFAGLATALAAWSLPRVRFESSPDATGLPVRSLLSGGFGALVALAFLPPRFVLGLALGVRLALGVIIAAGVLLGAAGVATAVVLVQRREDERLVVEEA
jgi:hypothetical protein